MAKKSNKGLIKNLCNIPIGDNEGQYTKDFRIGLMNAKHDLKHDRVIPHEQVKKHLKI